MSANQLWGIEEAEEIPLLSGSSYTRWYLDLEAGLFTDYDLATDEVSRRNQAERSGLEEQLEQDYQKRLAAWRTSVAENEALVTAGLRSKLAPGLMEPQRSHCIHTDIYRVSQVLSVHSRA